MRWTKPFYTAALLLSVLILFLFSAVYFTSVYPGGVKVSYYSLNDSWSYTDGYGYVSELSLPAALPEDDTHSVTITACLPQTVTDSDILQFQTGNYDVWVYQEGRLIYENTADKFSLSKTTGNVCHFVKLHESMAGKPVSITFKDVYSHNTIRIGSITFGNERDVLYSLVVGKLPAYIACVLMFCIGCFGLVFYLFFHKRLPDSSENMLWLAFFAIAFSAWSGFECQLMTILFPYHLAFTWYTFVALKLVLIPTVMFISHTYQEKRSRLCKALVFASILDITITPVLQFTGIADFRETLFVTCILFALTILWIFSLSLSTLHQLFKSSAVLKQPRTLKQLHIVFLLVLAVTLSLDFVSYFCFPSGDSGRFSRVTLLAYIIMLAFVTVRNLLDLARTKEKVQDLKEMAVTDPLTKLKNRASFEKDLAAIPRSELDSYGIAMFDLNNLKYFNDVHGHGTGDYYIIICSEILQDIFYSYGNVYRVGGDEFCAIMKSVSPKKYAQLSAMISSRLAALHQSIYNYRMEVSDGYAVFDIQLDKSLLHTMERADKIMYQKKQAMKKVYKPER